MRVSLSLAARLCGPLMIAVSVMAAGENLIANGSFEQAAGSQPDGWRTHDWAGTGSYTYVESGREGSHAVRIAARQPADLCWQHTVAVKPGSIYRLSGWIRTEDIAPGSGRGALFNVHGMQTSATPAVTGDSDWTHVESIVRVGSRDSITVNCLFGGWGQSTGTAYYDDVRLDEVDMGDVEPAVTIHAQRAGVPIDTFIYGQFIEHLGRCIYGGIWAEMLEDRKFYFPITADYNPYRDRPEDKAMRFPVVARSPWQIIGDSNGVTMVTADSFVGEHTPLVQPGAAIQQNDLGIVAGEKYVGYVWLKSTDAAEATVTLGSARGSTRIVDIGDDYTKHEFAFTAEESTDKASLNIAVSGAPLSIGAVSLMPANNVEGMRPAVLELIKELDSPIYRWPGGQLRQRLQLARRHR